MRVILSILNAVLYLIAFGGLGSGVYMVIKTAGPGRESETVLAMAVASIPFLIGTVALVGGLIVSAVMAAHDEIATELRAMHRLGAEAASRAKRE